MKRKQEMMDETAQKLCQTMALISEILDDRDFVENWIEDGTETIEKSLCDAYYLLDNIGFRTKFLGGYFASHNENITMYNRRKPIVMADPNVSEEHKTFIRDVEIRDSHFWYKNKPCGIGGVYELYK